MPTPTPNRLLVPIVSRFALRAGLATLVNAFLVLSAQSEPEMARDRFGFLERHGFDRRCIAASDPWSPIDAASSNQLREM